jgi:hypothetical protein
VAASATATASTAVGTTETGINLTVDVDTVGGFTATSPISYTVKVPGTYKISYQTVVDLLASGVIVRARIKVNGTEILQGFAQSVASGSYDPLVTTGTKKLNAGDVITVVGLHNGAGTYDFTGEGNLHRLSIEMLQGPAQIAASETVSASFSTPNTTLMSTATTYYLDFTTKLWDSHGAVTNYNTGHNTTAGSAWTFTAPISGLYQVSVGILVNSATPGFNGSSEYMQLQSSGTDALKNLASRRPSSTEEYPTLNGAATHRLLAGQTIQIAFSQISGGSLTLENNAVHTVTITRVGQY